MLARIATVIFASTVSIGLASLGGCASQNAPVKGEFMFWPEAPEKPHIQFLTSISFVSDVTGRQGQFEEMIYGKATSSDLPLNRPFGIRFYDGKIYTCDANAHNVTILDLRKKEVRILGVGGSAGLMMPIDIAVAPDGLKYVADTGLKAIVAFDASDRYVGKIAPPGLHPVSVAVLDNELFVSDMRAGKIRVLDRLSGKELRTIGEQGAGPGKFGGPMGLAIDRQGNLFINDVVGCRIQKFSRDGKFISQVGGLGDRPGNLARPKHMAVDSSGILYAVDNAFQNVQMFNDKGQILMYFGGSGSYPGAMNAPAGVCVSETDLDLFAQYVHPAFNMQRIILVTNNFGLQKINIYAMGELKPGRTVDELTPNRNKSPVNFGTAGPTFGSGATELKPGDEPPDSKIPSTGPASKPAPTTAPAGRGDTR